MLTNFYEAFVALALVALGAPEQLEEAEALAIDIAGRPAAGVGTSLVADILAGLRAARGEFDTAEQAARQALAAFPVVFPPATATLGRILAAQGKMEEARAVLTEGLVRLARQGGTGFQDIKLHLAAVELWRALGEEPAARQALAQAAELIAERASRIPDAEARARYLGQVRKNVAVLTLHRPE